jgi:cobalt-zinc-cadmium efflux system outer membrane protein
MKIIKKRNLLFILLASSLSLVAQEKLQFSREQCEVIFLKENLQLIAEKLEISQAEAAVLQAKLWPNPTFTMDQVNLWATQSQTNGEVVSPPISGNFGKNLQFSFELEQLIQTAGKRKKLVELEKVSVEKSKHYFEDLLRNLKIEFRNQLTNLQHLQLSKKIYENQKNSIQKLTLAYQKQVEQGNTPKGEYVRLKALELEISKNMNNVDKEINEAQKELKSLMRLPSVNLLEITPEGYLKNTDVVEFITLNELINQGKELRPDYKLAELEQNYFDKLYRYERAQKTPDLTFKALYDRNGSTMLNFVGFGIAMDLPVFNRNQGNIKSAKIGIEQADIVKQQKDVSVENEIVSSYQNLLNAIQFYNQIEVDYENTLDELLTSYTKNFTNRNISLLEYLDFMNAYLENKKIILEAGKEVNERAEELNFSVGKDIIK